MRAEEIAIGEEVAVFGFAMDSGEVGDVDGKKGKVTRVAKDVLGRDLVVVKIEGRNVCVRPSQCDRIYLPNC
jgi:hypothetical protein